MVNRRERPSVNDSHRGWIIEYLHIPWGECNQGITPNDDGIVIWQLLAHYKDTKKTEWVLMQKQVIFLAGNAIWDSQMSFTSANTNSTMCNYTKMKLCNIQSTECTEKLHIITGLPQTKFLEAYNNSSWKVETKGGHWMSWHCRLPWFLLRMLISCTWLLGNHPCRERPLESWTAPSQQFSSPILSTARWATQHTRSKFSLKTSKGESHSQYPISPNNTSWYQRFMFPW